MSFIQLRIDDHTKKSAKKILDELGIDMSAAIKVYLNQIIINKGLPFKLVTTNILTPEEERNILKASKEAKKGKNVSGPFSTKKEIQDYLDSLK